MYKFYKYISATSNLSLIPIKSSFLRIKDLKEGSKEIRNFDTLVDYYQSGLSLEIEGVLKGYGYSEVLEIDNALNIYDQLKR